MLAASRTTICLALAVATVACGVVLPPAESFEDEPGERGPVTTKATNLPAPDGSDEDAGTSVGTPGAQGSAGDASPTQAPPSSRVYVVFVTSQVWSSDQIGGLSGADEKCTTLANATATNQNKKWAAWLSGGTSASANARLGSTPGPWARVDGLGIAANRAQLADDLLPLFAPIAVDEQGSFHGGDRVWTGTRADGNASGNTCNGWSGTNGRGLYGKISFVKPTWTQEGDVECGGDDDFGFGPGGGGSSSKPRHRLYCFEID